MAWNLYENEVFLKPLDFSNGKTQEDVVKEVLEAIKQGNKVIFIHGVCGTGKSAIALNIANELGKTSIIVPIKNLQKQYKRDYEGKKYLLNKKNEKLKISVITGRKNHKCQFLEDNKNAIPKISKEVNSNLYDIFSGKREKAEEMIAKDISANNDNIPCKIEIKEKNSGRIREYLRQNKKVKIENFDKMSDVKRMSIAPVCPYWSPVIPEKYEVNLDHSKKREYIGLNNTKFILYQRKQGCAFYEQFDSFIDSDVIVFNSLKYKLESALNRKPMTEVEIIDECDEFLDSFSNQRNINIDRLQNSLSSIPATKEESFNLISEIIEILKHIKRDDRIRNAINIKAIISLKETGIYDLFKILLKNPEIIEDIDEESYVYDVESSARMFENFLDESYVIFSKKDENIIASIVTTNLKKKFKEMIDKNKNIVLMSGTLHSKEVLKEIFGLENFKVIEAETITPGKINIKKTGLEMDCKYSNFSCGKSDRKDYLKALDKCVEIGEKPILIHVNSFTDLPDEFEIRNFELNNLITQEEMKRMQDEDKENNLIKEFKKGEREILFSTRCSRGVDFPGDECKSIIVTKFPNPNIQEAFWKILNKTNPDYYWSFYKDKARRELLQKVYRGLRFKEDKIDLLSPDKRVLEFFEKEN
jgi:Rad3-related DNA helicase